MNSRGVFLGYDSVRGFDDQWTRGERVELEVEALLRHAFVCGATGAGKTVFAKSIVEEAVLAGIPVIAVDFKGDLASLALTGQLATKPALREVFGEAGDDIHDEFVRGARNHRATEPRAVEFARRVDARLYTPNQPLARQVASAALPSFPEPITDELERKHRDEITEALVRGFASTIYGSEGKVKANEPAVKLIEELVNWCNNRGERLEGVEGIRRVLHLVQEPPFESIGGLQLVDYVPAKQLQKLKTGLNSRIVGAERARYEGTRLSVDDLIRPSVPGKTPLSVLYLGHVSEFAEQSLTLGQLCADIYRWMRSTGGSERLRLLLYIDELGGGDNSFAFYPSYPHTPPSKVPLNLLVRQGRSAGVGVVLATQNPMSVDVRGLANVNTWAIGRLTQRNDLDRIRDVLDRMPMGPQRAGQQIARMPVGSFLVSSDGFPSPKVVQERWLYSVHRQLSATQVRIVHKLLERASELGPADPMPEEDRSARPASADRPSPVHGTPAPDRRVYALNLQQHGEGEPSRGGSDPVTPPRYDRYQAVANPKSDTTETLTIDLEPRVWEVIDGERRWTVPSAGLQIGRSSSAQIRLEDPHVSRLHVALVPEQGDLIVRALQTKNMTRLDGRILEGEARLEDGEYALEVGSSRVLIRCTGPR